MRANPGSEVVTDPLKVFHQAIENSKPVMGTIGIRKAGKLYHVSARCYHLVWADLQRVAYLISKPKLFGVALPRGRARRVFNAH